MYFHCRKFRDERQNVEKTNYKYHKTILLVNDITYIDIKAMQLCSDIKRQFIQCDGTSYQSQPTQCTVPGLAPEFYSG